MRALILALPMMLCACSRSDTIYGPGSHLYLPNGVWSGDNVQVIATDSTTRVVVTCGSGRFAGNIELDSQAHFSSDGSWGLSPPPYAQPAQISGYVHGTSVTFAIAIRYKTGTGSGVWSTGPWTATLGKPYSSNAICPS